MTKINLQVNNDGRHITVTAKETDSEGIWRQLGQKVIDTRDDLFRRSMMDLGWTPPRVAPLAPEAMLTAMALHGAQVRKYTGEPYFHHLAEVAGMVASVGGPDEAVAASWLHDSREDQGYPLSHLTDKFGPKVARMVTALSDLEEGNRAARKAATRVRLAAAEPWVQTIKYADIISNAHSICLHDKKFAPVFCGEVRDLLAVMNRGDPRLYAMAQLAVSSPGEITCNMATP